jgi:type I restriction-modification system DNA methylase subunit/predicted type IV restriction endonuclease
MSNLSAIKDLANRFTVNRASYTSSTYNETQLRREFLDPFFEALGWDVSNKQGYAEAYKEVIHEDAVKIGTATKAPDYSFRVGGTRKFFVEAKKPFINIKDDIDPAFQLRRYAWSAKLPLSILTDFQEFAVYDCRLKPVKTDKASVGRILYIKYDEFEKRWDEIASIFSKDSVLKGSFDRFADTNRAKKGTTEVDDAFLSEIENWRDLLARNIAIRNENLSSRELNFAVQRTIDRLIFLRICEDRGIEDYGRLQAHLNGENVYKRLCVLFREADERYNSGLFHFRDEKGREETPDNITLKLDIDDKVLKQIIQNLYYPDSAYEFSVLPADILGQVYEQFLGKVIRLTAGHQAKVEDKPEVKKAGGVFYTPTYIVDYIVKNTVGKLLEDKTPKQASALRILDPACGSGSFLIGVYQYLLDWHRDWYTNNAPEKWVGGKNPTIYKARAGEYRLATPERKRILLNNIYGVDIDTQAVEVTKLSLLLKVLEGENEQSIAQQLKLFHERALPDLGNNIKCGNSLIGTDYFVGVQESMGLYADEDDEQTKINAFDWEEKRGFQDIMKNGGFDAVIGNPPYGALFSQKEKNYIDGKYNSACGRYDSYWYFLEKSLLLTRNSGATGLIIPDTWFTLKAAEKLRRSVLSYVSIVELTSLHENVFRKVRVDVCTIILNKRPPTKQTKVRVAAKHHTLLEFSNGSFEREYKISQKEWLDSEESRITVNISKSSAPLLKRIMASSITLGDIAIVTTGPKPYQVGKGIPPQTKNIIETKPFTANNKKNKTFRPMLRGADISRYSWPSKSDEWLSYGEWLAEIRNPRVFEEPRLLIQSIRNPKLSRRIIGTFTNENYVNNNSITNVIIDESDYSLYFVLGILNSSFVNWIFSSQYNIVNIDPRYLKMVPIPTFDFSCQTDRSRHDRLVTLATTMLNLNKNLPLAKTDHEKTVIQRQIDSTDRRIDELVYELYDLTHDEIAIVEGANG